MIVSCSVASTRFMTTTKKRIGLLSALASLILASGCVTTEPAGVTNPAVSQTFTGYASNPGATVELYAFSKQANAWEPTPDTTTTASSTPTNYGGRTVYSWSMPSTLLENPTDWCRVELGCSQNGSGGMRIQFREVGGDFSPLLTFDNGGVGCTITAVNNGGNLFESAWNCRAQVFDELRFSVVQ